MKNVRAKKILQQSSMVLVYFALFVAVIFLMRYVQNLLNTDVEINLTEVVTQNKDVITSKLKVEMNDLDLVSRQISERLNRTGNTDGDAIKQVFYSFSNDREYDKLFVAGLDGAAVFSDGKTLDIYGRKYYQASSQGVQNISDRLVSRKDGEDIFVISVPINHEGKTIGTLQKFYTPEEMYDICSISLFSSEGYMYIINKEGYILISSLKNGYARESDNYFRTIYSMGNPSQAERLQEDIENERAGFMETTVNGEKIFSAYTPIEDVRDWYLISSVPTAAVSQNASNVITMFYCILTIVVLIFVASILGFLTYKNRQQTKLERIAFVDDVTGGNTYGKFLVTVERILKNKQDSEFYLFKFDIEHFKYINSFHGFDYGDKVLLKTYQTVQEKLTGNEVLARISGDHFIALIEDPSEERLMGLLELVENECENPIYVYAGIYKITDRSESLNLMVDKASTAAETAKRGFDKKVQAYSEENDLQVIKNERLKFAVKKAFENDEIVPFFQPKVDINTGEVVAAEALARWINADGKIIPPFEFIPVCEQTGMIIELDEIIWEKSLQFLRHRIDNGLSCVPISVNFSRFHLLDQNFFEKVNILVKKYDIPADLIEFELTESAVFDNLNTIFRIINQFHEAGFKVSMDDFGSGYSSLNMLKDIPIDVLKIDKEFLNQSTDNTRQQIIFSAIIQMANKLNIKVVVEGVETKEHVQLMKDSGCSIAQGYFYSKPIDEKTFRKILGEGLK